MKLHLFFILAFFFITFSCKKETTPPDASFEFEPINQEGTIGFWPYNGINKYTIYYHVPGTIDSQVLGILDNLDSEFRTEGTKVIFSGEYAISSENPQPILGGQTIYSLTLTSIELK